MHRLLFIKTVTFVLKFFLQLNETLKSLVYPLKLFKILLRSFQKCDDISAIVFQILSRFSKVWHLCLQFSKLKSEWDFHGYQKETLPAHSKGFGVTIVT